LFEKQGQKQKQKQQNKNQDSDEMGIFNERHRLALKYSVGDYFESTRNPMDDQAKLMLNQPISVPILTLEYTVGGNQRTIHVYPTVQFLYSHHIRETYIDEEVKAFVNSGKCWNDRYDDFIATVKQLNFQNTTQGQVTNINGREKISFDVERNFVRQNPQYTIAALETGVYIIGMKDQFNIHDLQINPLRRHIQYITDEIGFILYDRTESRNIDIFGPYFIEQYIIMEVLMKQEVAQNVLDYYCNNKEMLQRGLDSYNEKQGKGFICWRFLINETAKAMAAAKADEMANGDGAYDDSNVEMESVSKRKRHSDSERSR